MFEMKDATGTISLIDPDPLVKFLLLKMEEEEKAVVYLPTMAEFNRAHNIMTIIGEVIDRFTTILDDNGAVIYAVDIYKSIAIIYRREEV